MQSFHSCGSGLLKLIIFYKKPMRTCTKSPREPELEITSLSQQNSLLQDDSSWSFNNFTKRRFHRSSVSAETPRFSGDVLRMYYRRSREGAERRTSAPKESRRQAGSPLCLVSSRRTHLLSSSRLFAMQKSHTIPTPGRLHEADRRQFVVLTFAIEAVRRKRLVSLGGLLRQLSLTSQTSCLQWSAKDCNSCLHRQLGGGFTFWYCALSEGPAIPTGETGIDQSGESVQFRNGMNRQEPNLSLERNLQSRSQRMICLEADMQQLKQHEHIHKFATRADLLSNTGPTTAVYSHNRLKQSVGTERWRQKTLPARPNHCFVTWHHKARSRMNSGRSFIPLVVRKRFFILDCSTQKTFPNWNWNESFRKQLRQHNHSGHFGTKSGVCISSINADKNYHFHLPAKKEAKGDKSLCPTKLHFFAQLAPKIWCATGASDTKSGNVSWDASTFFRKNSQPNWHQSSSFVSDRHFFGSEYTCAEHN